MIIKNSIVDGTYEKTSHEDFDSSKVRLTLRKLDGIFLVRRKKKSRLILIDDRHYKQFGKRSFIFISIEILVKHISSTNDVVFLVMFILQRFEVINVPKK
jgi:hypothetical protein